MAYEEAQVLKRRAKSFLKSASRLIREGEYDLAVFNPEQYCQLILKYALLLLEGTYPRTHSISDP